MRLDEIPSETEDGHSYYRPTSEQRSTLITAAKQDSWLWGVDRISCYRRSVEAEIADIESRDGGRLHQYAMERLARETSPIQVRDALATPVPPSGHCSGGWVRHFSTEYPCRGCVGCRPASLYAWAVSRFVWCAGVAPAHREVRVALAGFEALVAVGNAFAALASYFASFATMPDKLRFDYQRVRLGNWYEVVGGRGTARAYKGRVGRAAWIGMSETGTLRVGLEASGTRFYVAVGQVRRVEPDEFQVAEAAAQDYAKEVRKEDKAARVQAYTTAVKCDAGRNEVVLVVDGPCKGTIGIAFWSGEKQGRVRYGVRELGTASSVQYAKKGEVIREPMWIDATELRSTRQITIEQADDAVVRLDAIMVQLSYVHPDFDKAILMLSKASRCPIAEVKHARKMGPRKRRAS